MERQSYWSKVFEGRISRRRALAASGTALAASSLLTACGGSDSDETSDSSGLVSKPIDESKQAQRGGVIKWSWKGDPPNLDPSFASTNNRTPKNMATSLYIQMEPAYAGNPQSGNVVPDLAESWEVSPDKTQITFKMRPGVKFHNLPPLNGRELDKDDLLFSWERLLKVNANRVTLANAVNPDAPILGISAPDDRTIVVKLKRPVSYIFMLLADQVGGNMVVVPKEADSTLDLRRTLIGTGPYMLTSYEPSVGLNFKRHPEYYDRTRPYADEVQMPIVTEYATAVSQFRAGSMYTYEVRVQDVLQLKTDLPDLVLQQNEILVNNGKTAFGWLPQDKSPYLDQRVRQAYSMAIDRDLFIDASANVSEFEAQGLPMQTRWNTSLPTNYEGYWLDPKGKDFGANAKYYEYNPAESKKLLEAAGYGQGIDVVNHWTSTNGDARQREIMEGFAQEAGWRITTKQIDPTKEYIPMRDSLGQFEGWLHKSGGTSGAGPNDAIGRFGYEYYSKGGVNFYGFNAQGKSSPDGDPWVDMMIEKGIEEFDVEKRKAITHEMQRYLAEKLYIIYYPGSANGFSIGWPCLRNFGVYSGTDQMVTYWWVDPTKPPIKAA